MIVEHFYHSRDELLQQLQQVIISDINSAIAARQQACVFVSGGSSPQPLYRALAKQDLAWPKVSLAMVDERWVEPEHKASNELFLRQNLLQDYAAAAKFTGLKNSAETAEQGLKQAETAYQDLAETVDIILLGMGPDGHTASLFPHAQGLAEAFSCEQLLATITATPSKVTGDYTERMTLGLKGILRAERIILLISGEEKLAAYNAAKAENDIFSAPVAAVLNQTQKDVHVYWAP